MNFGAAGVATPAQTLLQIEGGWAGLEGVIQPPVHQVLGAGDPGLEGALWVMWPGRWGWGPPGGWALSAPGVDARLAVRFALRLAVRCEVRVLGLDQLNRGSVSPFDFSGLR